MDKKLTMFHFYIILSVQSLSEAEEGKAKLLRVALKKNLSRAVIEGGSIKVAL